MDRSLKPAARRRAGWRERPAHSAPRHQRVYLEGTDPDYRFSLANERTFLAWNRTALALIAGGLGVMQFLPDLEPVWLRRALALVLVACGGVVAATSIYRWERFERAIRRGEPLPPSDAPRMLATGIAIGTVIVTVLIVLGGTG